MARRILIAEDNESVATALGSLLEGQGLTVERAADGVQALTAVAAAPPDLLILDLRLPRLHGLELLKKVRQSARTRDLSVVIISGAGTGARYRQAARTLGVEHFLEKPFKASDLLQAVRKMLPGEPRAAPDRTAAGKTFDRHLLQAFRDRFSGTLQFAPEDGGQVLTLANGAPLDLRPGFTVRDFGDYLRANGRLSGAEYAYYAGAGGFQPDCLVQLGCLDHPQLLEAKLDYLYHELAGAFVRPPAAARRTAFELPPTLHPLTVNVPRLLYHGYHRALPGATAGRRLLDRLAEQFAAPAPGFYRFINFLPLDEEEREVLATLDGSRTVAAALAGNPALTPLLRTLQALGMLRFAPEPLAAAQPGAMPIRVFFNAAADFGTAEDETLESFADVLEQDGEGDLVVPVPPAAEQAEAPYEFALAKKVRQTAAELEGKNYYEVFGLNPGGFSFDKLRERYFALTRDFGPEVLMRLGGEEAALVEKILATITTAYNTLSDVVKKERYDELLDSDRIGLGQKGDDRFQAEVQAQSGKVFLEMEEWDNAEQALRDACNGDPDNGDYLAHLAWAIYRNPRNAASAAMIQKARQQVNRALTLERTPHGFAFKGWMLFEAGQDGLAESEFGKALKLDARHPLARRGLRTLQEKREQEKKGLFRRMFR